MYQSLEEIISKSSKPKEIVRAQAVKQDLAGKARSTIAEILDVSVKFISKWRLRYDAFGAAGLKMGHKGSKGYLDEGQWQQAISHVQDHKVFGPKALMEYLQATFGVVFKSMQSYYELLHEAGMSWHKSQKANPRKDEEKIRQRRKEIKKS